MISSNQHRLNRENIEYTLKEKPISLGCIVAHHLIQKWTSKHESKDVSPKDLLIGTNLEFAHNFFKYELQNAIAVSKIIHPNVITTLHLKIRGIMQGSENCGSKSMPAVTNYFGDRKLETKSQVMWSQQDRIVEIYINTQGGLPPPSIISHQIANIKKACSLQGVVISLKFQSQTGMTKIGLKEDDILVHEGVINESLSHLQPKNEWIQFRPFWKIEGINETEIDKYIYTCTQIVLNRLLDEYSKDGNCELSVPHLTGKVTADSTMIETYSCPCNIYKCRGVRENPGWANKICPFMGHELHPRGYINYI